jgi:squalene-hopene/tetraprenyl-beta-curcumene cyclase
LPFDRSSADITAHALRAWLAWIEDLPKPLRARTRQGLERGVRFLARSQRLDGAWAPLWFGNEFAPDEQNLTYGTARILSALVALAERQDLRLPLSGRLCGRAIEWLFKAQNSDGGWGGAPGVRSSVEETALAVEALAAAKTFDSPDPSSALARGLQWLVERVESGHWTEPSAIGFYFAKLWYYERLYPLIFTVGALGRASSG